MTDVRDDAPIALPVRQSVPEPVYIAEIYLHRPIQEGLRATRFPDAGDVNSVDEVPRSSWFVPREPSAELVASGPTGAVPPVPPLVVLAEPTRAVQGGISVIDARGIRYELGIDRASRAEMRTAAAVIGARIGWALGYNTPPSCIARVKLADFVIGQAAHRPDGSSVDVEKALWAGPPPMEGTFRVSAVVWPPGLDLGSTPEGAARGDDPNDLVAHRDRRTLRALTVVASWLKLGGMGVNKTWDIYRGPPPLGHVEHYVIGWDDALGAGSVVEPSDLERPRSDDTGGSLWFNLLTLGLVPPPRPAPTQTWWSAVGNFQEDVSPAHDRPSPAYEPSDRMLPQDAYWIAKRIARMSPLALANAIDAGAVRDPDARDYLLRVLLARRWETVRYWFSRVTPLEIESVHGHELLLRDQALYDGYERSDMTSYLLEYLDREGTRVAKRVVIRDPPARFRLVLPKPAFDEAARYLVIRMRATRNGRASRRVFEAHLRRAGEVLHVVGVRH